MTERTPDFETLAIHAGAAPDPATGARAVPIYQTTAYVFDSADHAASLFNLQQLGFIYTRLTNPTVSSLAERIATLEGGVGAVCTSSGHAAQILSLFPLMYPGNEVVASSRLYGGSINQLSHAIRKFGWKTQFADPADIDTFRKAVNENTRAIFIEPLANPGGSVVDVEAVARVAEEAGVPLICDNTLATPYLLRPIDYGADIVLHSTTKFLQGQGTSLGGVIVDSGKFNWMKDADKFPSLAKPAPEYHGLVFAETFGELAYTFYGVAVSLRDFGATQAPMNAWLTIQGIETLPLRMEKHCSNALKVAEWLEKHPAVSSVSYAGLASNEYNDLAKKYLPKGAGAVFCFSVKGGYEVGIKLVENVELLSHVANLGDIRSLIIHPASTTHRQLDEPAQIAAGAGPDVVRLSIGLESAEDIIADLSQALDKATA